MEAGGVRQGEREGLLRWRMGAGAPNRDRTKGE